MTQAHDLRAYLLLYFLTYLSYPTKSHDYKRGLEVLLTETLARRLWVQLWHHLGVSFGQ